MNTRGERNPRRPAAAVFIRRARPYGLAALSGCLLCLSFPRWELSFLAWIALIPLFLAIHEQSISKAFLLGWLTGIIYFGGTLSWIAFTLHNYGRISWGVSLLLMSFFLAYLSAYFGLFAALIRYLRDNRLSTFLVVPAVWTTSELIRGRLFTGFPWAHLGYSQYRFLPLVQIADIGSVYAVGYVVVLVNAVIFKALREGRKAHRIAFTEIAAVTVILALTFSYGMFRLAQPMGDEKPLSVSVVQGNIDQVQKWDTQFREKTVQTYKRLSRMSLEDGIGARPELVIWPESVLPFFFEEEPDYQNALLNLAMEENVHLLFGSPAYIPTPSGKISLLNSAYLLSPKNRLFSRYDKMHLVPFGEYVPLPALLSFVNKMVEGLGDFVPGREAKIMEIGTTKIGTVICFEVAFPEVVRQFVQNGARVMTTITNDAWFGRSAAPHQHFSMVVFRAIENRLPFARAANTGISGFIDARGKITKQSSLFVEATLSEDLLPGNRSTFYTVYGDVFAVSCAIITLILIVIERTKRRKTDAF